MRPPSAEALAFRVLGPLEVTVGGHPLALGGPKQRLVLGGLLANPNQPVAVDWLIGAVWDGAAPARAARIVQTYVSALRSILRDAGLPSRIRLASSGYVVETSSEELDLLRFEIFAGSGQELLRRGQHEEAARLLADAAALWRGRPLAGGLMAGGLRARIDQIEDQHLEALQAHARALAALGRHGEIVRRLTPQVREHPLREPLWLHLITALHACGRRAEAMAAYAQVRRVLRDELGSEPGVDLRGLHERILREEHGGVGATAPPAAPVEVRIRGGPCQLPPDLPDLTGRDGIVAELVMWLRPGVDGSDMLKGNGISRDVRGSGAMHGDRAGTGVPRIGIVSGAPGVGKSSVAVRVAHSLRDWFPDGQLYANLAGGTAAPKQAADVIVELLRTLGVDERARPGNLDEMTAWYRSLLADRRILLVLDDAAAMAQVRPLLPGTSSCALLVTSRASLRGFPGAHHVNLDVLTFPHAIELLGRIAGPERVAREPDAAARIAVSCGRLPLALRIAGAKLAHRCDQPMAKLADQLAAERSRIDLLRLDDLAVRNSVASGYDMLDPVAAQAFRALGVVEAGDIPSWVVPVLLDQDRGAAEALAEASLLQIQGYGADGEPRYRMHDLVRLYARELLDTDTAFERTAARRLVHAWLSLASVASGLLPRVYEEGVVSRAPAPPGPAGAALDAVRADPAAWFERELLNLVAAVRLAVRYQWAEVAVELGAQLSRYLSIRSRVAAQEQIWTAIASVAALGDSQVMARADHGQAVVAFLRRDLDRAKALAKSSLDGFEKAGDDTGTGAALTINSWICLSRARPDDLTEAHRDAERARKIFEGTGDDFHRAQTLQLLGRARAYLGDPDEGLCLITRAHELMQELGQVHGQASTAHTLAFLHQQSGRHRQAVAWGSVAFDLTKQLKDDYGAAHARLTMSMAYLGLGEHERAYALLHQLRTVFARTGDARGAAIAKVYEARSLSLTGRISEAITCLREAIPAMRDSGESRLQHMAAATVLDVHNRCPDHSTFADLVAWARGVIATEPSNA